MLNFFQQYVTHDHTANFTFTSIQKYPKVVPHIQKKKLFNLGRSTFPKEKKHNYALITEFYIHFFKIMWCFFSVYVYPRFWKMFTCFIKLLQLKFIYNCKIYKEYRSNRIQN